MTPIPFEHIELKIMEAGFDRVDNSWNRFIKLFPYYRIYYIVSGKAVIYLQDYQLNLKPGKLYFIPSFSIFDAHCDEILGHYWIHFNFDITTASYLTIYPPKREAEAPPFVGEIFRNLLQHVGGYQQSNSPADAIACEGLIKYLLSFFLPDTVSAAPEAVRFVPVLQYIDSHFDSHISNADLGKIMFLSPPIFPTCLQSNSGSRRSSISSRSGSIPPPSCFSRATKTSARLPLPAVLKAKRISTVSFTTTWAFRPESTENSR